LGRRGVQAGFVAWKHERIESTWMTKRVLKIILKGTSKEYGDSLWTGFIRQAQVRYKQQAVANSVMNLRVL
jgi:hypothetical protein